MADKLTLPKAKFAHELTAGPVDPTMKAAEATSTKLYRVPVSKIKTIPGFNVRVESADYIEHRDNIQSSIAANGYDQTKPLAGYVAKEGDENVIYVTDGHTRLAAVLNYNESAKKDQKIAALPVMVHPKEVSLTDLTVALHTANNGRPLTPFELGVVVKRLLAEEGADKKTIAARLGVTARYLDDVLLLANADSKVRQYVASGDVSSTMAIQLLRKDSDSAADKIASAVKKAADTGKKATKKHTGPKMDKIKVSVPINEGDDIKEVLKSLASEVRKTVPLSEQEDGDETVKVSNVEGLISMVIEIPATEKPKAKPKAKGKAKAKAKTEIKAKAKEAAEEATTEAKAAAKKVAKGKAAPKKAKKAKGDDIGIAGAEAVGEDDEEAILPPKVSSDADVPDDEEVDI